MADFKAVAFPLRAARESVRRGWRCFPRWLPGAPHVAGRLPVASLEVRAGPAGCGRTLCRHALPGGVVARGMYQRYRRVWFATATLAPTLRGTLPSIGLRFGVASHQFRATSVRFAAPLVSPFRSLFPLSGNFARALKARPACTGTVPMDVLRSQECKPGGESYRFGVSGRREPACVLGKWL